MLKRDDDDDDDDNDDGDDDDAPFSWLSRWAQHVNKSVCMQFSQKLTFSNMNLMSNLILNISCNGVHLTLVLAGFFYRMNCEMMNCAITFRRHEIWGGGNGMIFSWSNDGIPAHPPNPVMIGISFNITSQGDWQSNLSSDVARFAGDLRLDNYNT